MHENEMKNKERAKVRLDSWSLGTPKSGQLKIYLDILDREDTEARLNAFKHTVNALKEQGWDI